MSKKAGRLAGLMAIMVAAIGIGVSPASGGVIPEFQNNVNTFKVGKFKVRVDAFSDSASASVFTRSQFLSYRGGAQKDESGRIKGNFGNFGKVDLTFHKAGPFKDQKLPNGCTGTPSRKQKGTWKGVIKLKTEKSIVNVTKHEISGSIVKPGNINCELQPTPDSVSLALFKPMLNFQATVRKSGGKPKFLTFTGEVKGGAAVTRGVFAKGKASDFKYASDYSSGKVSPPSPYSGTGKFVPDLRPDRGSTVQGTLEGNLKARFLGLAGKKKIGGQPAQLGEGVIFRGDSAAAAARSLSRWKR